jgi:hypothetical protein
MAILIRVHLGSCKVSKKNISCHNSTVNKTNISRFSAIETAYYNESAVPRTTFHKNNPEVQRDANFKY